MRDWKKGFSSVWESEKQIDELLPAIAESGFHGIEPTFIPGAVPSPHGYAGEARLLRGRCEALGLEIPSMRGGRGFWDTVPSPDPAERAAALEHGKLALECLAMGVWGAIGFPGTKHLD